MAQKTRKGYTHKDNRASELLEFIKAFWKENFFSPSTRDIADHMHTSTSVVDYYLMQLERDGLILERSERKARMIIPIEIRDALVDSESKES